MPDLTLRAGAWQATLRPEVGGALAALRFGGIDLLRPMAAGARHPLEASCFPLVPYCNRIAEGRFVWGEREVRLGPNLPPQRHPLHGFGWLRPWRVVRSDAASALLEDDYAGGGDWPWPYRAHLHAALDESGCSLRLMATNTAAEPAPMGLGVHPYFRRSSDTRVTFAADTMLGVTDEVLPDGIRHPADHLAPWSTGAALPDVLVDHCFTGWSGAATIADAHGTITLRGFGALHCHLYAPPGGGELCLEPVNHVPDALNTCPQTMPVVQPGCASGIALRIEATGG